MKNVSSNFRNELNNGNRNYVKSADITLKNGTVLHIDNSKLWNNGLKIENAVSNTDSFDISSVIIGQLTLTLLNINDEFSEYDFTDCVASNVKVGLKLEDGTTESLSYGKFYLNETNYSSEVITLTFYDCLYKFDKSYSESKLQYPATLNQIVRDACDVCGVTMGTVTFDNDDYVVQDRPSDESLTFRQVLLWVGQISVHYFYADEEGRLAIGWYDIDGTELNENDTIKSVLRDIDGNIILDVEGNQIVTDIESGLSSFVSLSTHLDDVVITGIRVLQDIETDNGQQTVTYQSGNDGYVLSVSGNKFVQGDQGSYIASMIAAKVVGVRFRGFSATCLSDPTIECGDSIILVDRKGRRYKSIVTNNTFQPGNFQNLSCGAETPARNSATRYSQITQVYVDYRKEIEKEKTDREQALEDLSERVNSSAGVFTTVETLEDGSKKYYLHNKPLLSESDIIWTMTAEAWTVSTDGGKTVNAGMTVDGDTIVRILTAVGVNADWIKTGAFRIEKDGKVMFNADTETGQIDIIANSFSLQGKSVEDIANEQVNDFVSDVLDPQLSNLQSQIDGQIQTYYYDYEPTLGNIPASEWTTEEERQAHEGDLFYWKSKGYAYRFFKDGDIWKWQMVQDTDITAALEQASEAQDTADQKRRVFVSQPYPPYDIGDLWVGDDSSDLMVCIRTRASGNFDSSDWQKAVKYTDDSELYNFIDGEYADTIEEIKTQNDQKAETWYQSSDPATNWDTNEKSEHAGDIWYNTATEKTYIYNGTSWQETKSTPPDEVFDAINGKATIFITQPVPPYDVGDIWFTGTIIMVCNNARDSGDFASSDWEKRDNYTDDTALQEFMDGEFQETVQQIKNQSDQKAETWYQSTDPSDSWTSTEEKNQHRGDLWYNTSSQQTYIYNGTSWQETKSSPPDNVFDIIDGKAQIFVNQPVPPYNIGDLWFDSNTSDIMTCITSRTTGSFNPSDWQKRNKYTDDSALENFIEGDYRDTISDLKAQSDQKAETWYQSNDPSDSWSSDQKSEHKGDLWYSTNDQKTYIYNGSSWQETKSTPPDEIFDVIDGKATIFVSQPTPPYSVGDVWFTGTMIMVCETARDSGNFVSSDWKKRDNYTDDTSLQEFMNGEYQNTINELQKQSDQKAETWYQSTDPSTSWTTTSEKTRHDGDLWYNSSTEKTYIYNGSTWQETKSTPPDDVFDIIDGKASIFISQPKPPYHVGDLWFNSTTSDIMTCVTSRESGNYVASDWQKRNKYTDDSYAQSVYDNLQNFADQVTGDISDVQSQIDGKIETYYYNYQPTLSNVPASAWTTDAERQKHVGDLFYWQSKGYVYRFQKNSNTWTWQQIKDSDIEESMQIASEAQDTADSKRRVFTSTPYPPYDVGDLWAQGSTGDIMRCKTARQTGSYVSSDWEKASKYTDDSAVDDLDNSLNQQGVFDRLTNDGQAQGIFLENGQLYMNGEYMEFNGATIGGWLVSGNQLRNDQTNFEVKIQAPTVYGPSGLSTADIIAVHDKRKNTWPFVVTSDGSMDLGDEFQYRPNGFAYDSTVQMNVGGWQIKKAQNVWGYNEVIYWDTIETQTNGIGAKGPWVIWGGWNGRSSLDYVNNYKFVVSDQGNVYGQRFYDNGQQLLPIVVEVTHKILTNDYCYVSKSGYYLLACYLIRPVDHSIYVKAIQYRNDNTYTVALQGTNGGEIDLYTMWAKMPD